MDIDDHKRASFPLACLAAGAVLLTNADAQRPPIRGEDVVGLEHFRGSDAAREFLLKQGFVVAANGSWKCGRKLEPLRQVFSVYVKSPLPSFVTLDLVLDGYTALLEKVVLAVERRQAPKLLAFSRRLAAVAKRIDHPRGKEIAWLAGAALAIQLGETEVQDRGVRRVLARLRGSRALLPDLLQAHAGDIEPHGAYDGDHTLAGYFRARRFYQLCDPADNARGQRLAVAFAACMTDPELRRRRDDVRAPFVELLGEPLAGPLLGGHWTPMFELCGRSEDQHEWQCATTGLSMLVAGPLRSPAGHRIFAASGRDLARAGEIAAVEAPDTHHGRFLRTLQLLQQPDPRAPALFRTGAWADLQANTQLGAWAQARHAWVLQAQTYSTRGVSHPPTGRVAPYPKAYAALSRDAASLRSFWQRTSLAAGGVAAAQASLGRGIEYYDTMLKPKGRRVTPAQADIGVDVFRLVSALLAEEAPGLEAKSDRDVIERARAATAAPPDQLAKDARALLERFQLGWVGARLNLLSFLCRRLAAIAERQLAGTPPAPGDAQFLQDLGPRVGGLHGYDGNSWRHPRDDHARVTPVARLDGRGVLQVGVARPEPLYLILPHNGRPVLYCGAVLSYRERLAERVWRDDEWRKRVARRGAPRPPAFTASFRR